MKSNTYINQKTISIGLTLLALVLALSWYDSFTRTHKRIKVYTFSREMERGESIVSTDLSTIELEKRSLTTNMFTNQVSANQLTGKKLVVPVQVGQLVLDSMLSSTGKTPDDVQDESVIKEMIFQSDWFEGGLPLVYSGDTISVFTTKPTDPSRSTAKLLEHVIVGKIVSQSNGVPTALQVQLTEDEVETVLRAHADRSLIKVVVKD